MIACNTLITSIQNLIDDESTETKAKILNHLNTVYMDVAAEHAWHSLITNVTQSGAVLPADCQRILFVEDGQDVLYFVAGFPQKWTSQRLYNYYSDVSVSTPLLTGSDGVVTANSTTVTSAAAGFTAAMVGEYIRIGQNRGIYKITAFGSTSSITIHAGFRGATASTQYFEVRPQGTKQLAFTNDNGAAITSSSRVMWYLQKPLPLYNDYDQILLPGECDALKISVLQLMMIGQKYDNDSLKQEPDYIGALSKMKSLEPVPDRFVVPRGKVGTRTAFGRQRAYTPTSIHAERFY